MKGIHGELVDDFGPEFTRMLSSAKLIPEQAEEVWGVPAEHISRVMMGKESPSIELEDAINKHAPLSVGDLYIPDVRRGISVPDDTTNGVVVCHADASDKTRRSLYRTESENVRFSVYDYADTAVSRTSKSTIIPERIWENVIVEDNFSTNMPKWACNQGHFEQQMTFFIGDITTYYLDKNGDVFAENMQKGDMEWHGSFIPHLFTKRNEKEALILAVTYRGGIGTREFLDSIKEMTEDEYLSRVRAVLKQVDLSKLGTSDVGYFVRRNKKVSFEKDGVYNVRTLLSNVPFQKDTIGLEYTFNEDVNDDSLDILSTGERWGYIIGKNQVKLRWEGNEEILEPNSSFFIRGDTPHSFRSLVGQGRVVIMQVQPKQEDPWKTLALMFAFVGEDGVKRARRETKQWTK